MLIGYARVSPPQQGFELQHEALVRAGCDHIFTDEVDDRHADRPGLSSALEMLSEGDTLIVWKLNRLSRNVKNLVELVAELARQGIHFRSVIDSIDTTTTSGKLFVHVMSSLSELERELTVERTRASLAVARRMRSGKSGRKRLMTDSKLASAKKLLASGVPPRAVAKNLEISVPTLYRWLPASTRA